MKDTKKLEEEIDKLLFKEYELNKLIQSKLNEWAKLNCEFKIGMKLDILYKDKYNRVGIIKEIIGKTCERGWYILVEGYLLTKNSNEDTYCDRFSFEYDDGKLYDHGEYKFIRINNI